jgi:hypothetical protein
MIRTYLQGFKLRDVTTTLPPADHLLGQLYIYWRLDNSDDEMDYWKCSQQDRSLSAPDRIATLLCVLVCSNNT